MKHTAGRWRQERDWWQDRGIEMSCLFVISSLGLTWHSLFGQREDDSSPCPMKTGNNTVISICLKSWSILHTTTTLSWSFSQSNWLSVPLSPSTMLSSSSSITSCPSPHPWSVLPIEITLCVWRGWLQYSEVKGTCYNGRLTAHSWFSFRETELDNIITAC